MLMMTEQLIDGLKNMVVMTLNDRYICDMAVIRLNALEEELELQRIRADKLELKLKEVQQ
jgi:hypothetical protein